MDEWHPGAAGTAIRLACLVAVMVFYCSFAGTEHVIR